MKQQTYRFLLYNINFLMYIALNEITLYLLLYVQITAGCLLNCLIFQKTVKGFNFGNWLTTFV